MCPPPQVGTYDYAGCLSTPRALWLDVDGGVSAPRLIQQPLPELASLWGMSWVWTGAKRRTGADVDTCGSSDAHIAACCVSADGRHGCSAAASDPDAVSRSAALRLGAGETFPIPVVSSPHLDIEVAFLQGDSEGEDGIDGSGLASGLMLRSWEAGQEGGAAVLYK